MQQEKGSTISLLLFWPFLIIGQVLRSLPPFPSFQLPKAEPGSLYENEERWDFIRNARGRIESVVVHRKVK